VAHQWHTLTKTGKVSSLNQLNPGPFLEINPVDAAALGAADGSLVKVKSARGFAIYPAAVTARVRPGNCFAPFHWNDLFGEHVAVNAATSDAVDPISRQPEFKYSAVALSLAAVELPGDFTAEQKRILHELLAGAPCIDLAGGHSAPALVETAPFTARQREHIDALFARLYAGHSSVETPP